jgi:carbon monoxide dehydrogenase subunit G
MIEADYTIELDVPVQRVWEYVETIPNWAPFVIGFQKLELVDERRSIWTLRGDVGILTRQVDIQADITTWDPLRRAEFTITGLTERLGGRGSFDLVALDGTSEGGPAGTPVTGPARPHRDGPLRRLRFAIARFLLRRLNRRSKSATPVAAPASAGPAPAAAPAGSGGSRLVFHLEVAPAGPMAPMIELLMAPMIEPAAQDFLRNVRAALEEGRDPAPQP